MHLNKSANKLHTIAKLRNQQNANIVNNIDLTTKYQEHETMKELDKKAFDQSYKYDDYKKQIKKECKQRQEARQQKRNWN